MVFCRESGWKDEDEAVEARDGVCSMTDMTRRAGDGGVARSGQAAVPLECPATTRRRSRRRDGCDRTPAPENKDSRGGRRRQWDECCCGNNGWGSNERPAQRECRRSHRGGPTGRIGVAEAAGKRLRRLLHNRSTSTAAHRGREEELGTVSRRAARKKMDALIDGSERGRP